MILSFKITDKSPLLEDVLWETQLHSLGPASPFPTANLLIQALSVSGQGYCNNR